MSSPTSASAEGWLARMATLGIRLPNVAAPVAAYVPAVRSGSLVFTSGQLPLRLSGEMAAGIEARTEQVF